MVLLIFRAKRSFVSLIRQLNVGGTVMQLGSKFGNEGYAIAARIQLHDLVHDTSLAELGKGLFFVDLRGNFTETVPTAHLAYIHRFDEDFYAAIRSNGASLSLGSFKRIAPATTVRMSVSTESENLFAASLSYWFNHVCAVTVGINGNLNEQRATVSFSMERS
jgi:hypothetical protein